MTDQEKIVRSIVDTIKQKTDGKAFLCPICRHNQWRVPPGYFTLSFTLDPTTTIMTGKTYPVVPLICTNCGNTHLLHLPTLGFSDLDAVKIAEEGGEGGEPTLKAIGD